MPKKKELPRKRKRFFRKVLFLCLLAAIIVIVAIGTLYFKYYQKSQKPQFIRPISAKPVTNIDRENKQFIELKEELTTNDVAYTALTKEKDGSFKVVLEKGGEVTFSSQKDIMTQIASLQYILSHLTMEGKLFSQLDLRFEKPVIKLRE
jgi:hypothetical protein